MCCYIFKELQPCNLQLSKKKIKSLEKPLNFSYALEIGVFQNSPVWFILSSEQVRVRSANGSRGPLGGGAVLGLPGHAVAALRELRSGLCLGGLWACGP